MNVALVGSSGYIAGYLLQRFSGEPCISKVLKIDQGGDAQVNLSLLEPEGFDYSLLDDIDYVIFTAAVSGPDKCADEYDFCWSVNVTGTNYFIREALGRNCKVLFFSSDAVFGDIPGEIYTEISETRAETPYGRMKKTVEDEFKSNPHFKAIRLSYVVSAKDRFVSYCLGCMERNETADVFHPFYRNCIVVSDVVDAVMWFMKHWGEYPVFALNVAGRELVSRIRIADELNRYFSNRLAYTISTPDGSFYRNRPQITQMKSLYIHKYGIVDEGSFTEKIQKELSFLA